MTRTPYTPGARQAKAEIPTDEQRVKAVYPQSWAYDTKRGGFDIIDSRDRDAAMSIGYGRTEQQAWSDCASRISPVLPASLPAETETSHLLNTNFQQAMKINEINGAREAFADKLLKLFGYTKGTEAYETASIVDEVKAVIARADKAEAELATALVDSPLPAEGVEMPPRCEREHMKQFATTLIGLSYVQWAEYKRYADAVEKIAKDALSETAALRKQLEEAKRLIHLADVKAEAGLSQTTLEEARGFFMGIRQLAKLKETL